MAAASAPPGGRGQLLGMQRYRDRITAQSLRRWRAARAGKRPSAASARPTRREAELAAKIDELTGEVDLVVRAGAPPALWGPIHDHLDALAADVELVLAAVD
jgi:hypothetical protein